MFWAVVMGRSYDRYWLLELLVPHLFDRSRCTVATLHFTLDSNSPTVIVQYINTPRLFSLWNWRAGTPVDYTRGILQRHAGRWRY